MTESAHNPEKDYFHKRSRIWAQHGLSVIGICDDKCVYMLYIYTYIAICAYKFLKIHYIVDLKYFCPQKLLFKENL